MRGVELAWQLGEGTWEAENGMWLVNSLFQPEEEEPDGKGMVRGDGLVTGKEYIYLVPLFHWYPEWIESYMFSALYLL